MMQASERKKREHNIDSFVVIKPEKMFHGQKTYSTIYNGS